LVTTNHLRAAAFGFLNIAERLFEHFVASRQRDHRQSSSMSAIGPCFHFAGRIASRRECRKSP
jgi:hypothetical protein